MQAPLTTILKSFAFLAVAWPFLTSAQPGGQPNGTATAATSALLGGVLPEGSAPVASPNRTTSAQLAAGRAINVLPPGQAKNAVTLIDADGRVLGRAMGSLGTGNVGIVTLVDNRNTLVVGLTPMGGCDAADNCSFGPGLRWGTFAGALFYDSLDCSGPPSMYFGTTQYLGFERIGVAVRDEGQDYIYFADPRPKTVFIKSFRYGFDTSGQCYRSAGGEYLVMPVTDVISASQFGRLPLRWK